MHQGNNRQNIFESEEGMIRIKEDIAHALPKSDCHLHAYVIMSNHLHLLITPTDKGQLSRFMQTMANRYVRFFNATRKRTGTTWEGRFKSCLIDSENYLFTLYRYTEATMRGEVYGTSEFHHKISQLISRATRLAAHGGDRKSEGYRNQTD